MNTQATGPYNIMIIRDTGLNPRDCYLPRFYMLTRQEIWTCQWGLDRYNFHNVTWTYDMTERKTIITTICDLTFDILCDIFEQFDSEHLSRVG